MESTMRRPHLPGFSAISNMNIANKLGLIVAVMAVPILALLAVQFFAQRETQQQAEKERDGLEYISTVIPFLREVQLHRGLALRVLAGDVNSVETMKQSERAAENALAAINEMDSRYGGRFGTKDLVAFLNKEWTTVKESTSSAETANAAHTRLIQEGIFPLLSTVATRSELVLDPDLDTRAVIAALTESLPRLTESLSLIRATGTETLLTRANLTATDAQKMFLSAQLAIASEYAESLDRQLQVAMSENRTFNETLDPAVRRAGTARSTFFDMTRNQVLVSGNLSNTAAEGFFYMGGSAIDTSNQLLAAAQETLNREFDQRAADARQQFYMFGGAAVAGVALALLLAVVISMSITRPVRHLAEVADRISLGELDARIDVESDNEIGRLAESLRRMQTSLRAAIERLRQRRQQAA
ncbi:HAMP domain-containing protein [Tepidiforma sp.]|jgi:HAMP domain-containing protein|uniref:HAMP domain-containing protein n=1 Tax=Tepidiforma sp. TaxID=2682230 RepID=UPI002614DB8F|nr:HAMP domain-containing protein [Tepidiforma sp.]MCX7618559.1 HAMP domain-containing protein [Tepidiforma sp.]